MKLARTSLALAVSLSLSACGGGGGGSATMAPLVTAMPGPSSLLRAATIDPLVGTSMHYAITDIRSQDLNANGVDEVVIGGRATAGQRIDSRITVMGWNADPSRLSDETAVWLPGNSNIIRGTEPSIKFGNFFGNGQVDMFVAGGNDQDHDVPGVLFKNNGNSTFSRLDLPASAGWAHDSAVADINGDGIADAVTGAFVNPVTILGGSNPVTISGGGLSQGSAIALGKFFGASDGVWAVIVSGLGQKASLQKFDTANNAWSSHAMILTNADPSLEVNVPLHNIRAEPVNLNSDHLLDLIVVSRPDAVNGDWNSNTEKSYVQFYRNLGNGSFVKTGQFVKEGALYYNVEIRDINGDGVNDILLSSQIGNSALLIGKRYGDDVVFSESATSLISAFEVAIGNAGSVGVPSLSHFSTGRASGINIAKGPNGKNYLVGLGRSITDDYQLHVFYSEITAEGAVTLEATVASLQAIWPSLTEAKAHEILTLSGLTVGNQTLIDLWRSRQPVGAVEIPTANGRLSVNGHISGVKLGHHANVIAIDSFGRDYAIDLSPTQVNYSLDWAGFAVQPGATESAVMSLMSNRQQSHHLSFSGQTAHSDSYSASVKAVAVNTNTAVSLTQAHLNHNPWLTMSGAWGKIDGANLTELAVLHSSSAWNYRTGVIRTTTDLRPGLVTAISPITSLWADIEHKATDGLSLAGGMLPYVVSGHVTASLPTGIGRAGMIEYQHVTVDVRTPFTAYLRMGYRTQGSDKYGQYTASGLITQQGAYRMQLTYRKDF